MEDQASLTCPGQPSERLTDPGVKAYIRMVLSILVGFAGLDRFYNRQVALGIVKLITAGGFGIWWIVDAAYYTYKAGQV
jgi:TM2 domain-containing membrane protein YozV